MTTQPEALRLADELDGEFVQGRISNHTGRKAAVEIRRLHAELTESEKWRDRDEARAASAERERDIAEAQRDALLEALKKIAAIEDKMVGSDWEEIEEAREIARTAIKKAEEA